MCVCGGGGEAGGEAGGYALDDLAASSLTREVFFLLSSVQSFGRSVVSPSGRPHCFNVHNDTEKPLVEYQVKDGGGGGGLSVKDGKGGGAGGIYDVFTWLWVSPGEKNISHCFFCHCRAEQSYHRDSARPQKDKPSL